MDFNEDVADDEEAVAMGVDDEEIERETKVCLEAGIRHSQTDILKRLDCKRNSFVPTRQLAISIVSKRPNPTTKSIRLYASASKPNCAESAS